MPERWERELTKLRDVQMHESAVRDRIARGPRGDRLPPRRERVVAGMVAAVVAIAAAAFLWQAIPGERRQTVGGPGTATGETPSLSPGPVVEDEPGSIVVTLFGYGERSAELPTAIVGFEGERRAGCTQDFRWTLANGEKVTGDVNAGCVDDPGIPVPAGTRISIAGSATVVQPTRTMTPYYEGDVVMIISAEWPEGEATFVVPLTVSAEESTPDEVSLGCAPADRVAFSPPSGARILPGDSAYITGNLPGFEPGDVVEQMTLADGGGAGGWDGTWQVVRDGSVIAAVDFASLNGVACRGSGIGGV